MAEMILTNARVVLADRVIDGTVATRGNVISDIAEGRSQLSSAIDCEGDFLAPAFVELHTDNLERHVKPRPATFWPCDAAVLDHDREIASAGITTVFNALYIGEVDSRSARVALLNEMHDAIEEHMEDDVLKADHYFHWRCEISYAGMVELLEPLIDHRRLRLVSIMDHTPGQRQFTDIDRYREYHKGRFGMSDEELDDFIAQRVEAHRKYSASNSEAVVSLTKARGLCLASHDDATVEHIDEAVRNGVHIAEFPTTFESAAAAHAAGLAVLMGAPNIVRGKSHSGNISARELGERGTLDILSSDYVPGSLLYGALLLEQTAENISLPQAIATIARNPARAVGLDDRGEIAIGQRADLVRFRDTGRAPIIRDVWRASEKIA